MLRTRSSSRWVAYFRWIRTPSVLVFWIVLSVVVVAGCAPVIQPVRTEPIIPTTTATLRAVSPIHTLPPPTPISTTTAAPLPVEWLAWISGQGGAFGAAPVPVIVASSHAKGSLLVPELINHFPYGVSFFAPSPDGRCSLKDGAGEVGDCPTGNSDCTVLQKRLYLFDNQSIQVTSLDSPWKNMQGIPTWSPDSQSWAAALYTTDPSGQAQATDLYRYDIASGATVQLTHSSTAELFPSWSPDGRYIAFARYLGSEGHGDPQICARYPDETQGCTQAELYLIAPDGSGERKLTHITVPGRNFPWQEGRNYQLAWSPDATRLAVMTGSPPDITIVSVTDDSAVIMAAAPAADRFPAWSPDGRLLLFVSQRDGNREIYRVGVDGQGLVNLTHDPSEDTLPAWSPTGNWIAFLTTRDRHPAGLLPYVMDDKGGMLASLINIAKDAPYLANTDTQEGLCKSFSVGLVRRPKRIIKEP